jgi:myxalamid-type polyketide synthase MxaD
VTAVSNPAASDETTNQLRRALTSLKDLRAKLEAVEGSRHEPIAIIGMGCRFPGAANPDRYWDLLRDGVDAIVETPADRWASAGLYDPDPEAPGRAATRWGGFLDQIDEFDASFFGISPREAAQMDPQQRLLLEVAWETFEDGGQAIERLAGTRTGVFMGVHSHSADYYLMQAGDPRHLDLYSGTGTSHSVVSGRLSYLLDLRGPSLAIDSACSSSLVAVHLAVQSLRNGECTLALAGGVNVMIEPTFTIVASRMRMMSAVGRCQPFDARADGFVRSEGCGAVLLKRLSDAVADGDRILAVINGSAVNQDGKSNGLTAPNSLSQQAVITEALRDAGLSADRIGMIEAHGTGTPLGDPIEVEALSAVFAGVGDTEYRCLLGAAKANIGHLEGAAGVAGVLKAVLALRHGEVPPLVHFETLNPHISLRDTPFVIPTTVQPWPASSSPRYAGVSSFGWSGTNAHVIIGEAPPEPAHPPADDEAGYILALSARSAPARLALAAAYRSLLENQTDASLRDVCATASLRRSHHEHRLAVAGRNSRDLIAGLDAFVAGDEHPAVVVGDASSTRRELVFVFPGQGSQWPGMARQLLATEAAFRDAIARCECAFAPYVDWSLVDQLRADQSRLDEIDVIQPVLFAIQVALAALWRSWGVEANAVVGHSMGEVAAAHVAGILSLDDAAQIICRRSQLLRRISGQGAMAVVDLSIEDARRAIEGHERHLAIAVNNSPSSTVLSGDPHTLDEVLARLERSDVFCRRINVDVASHSPQVDSLHDDLVAGLAGVRAGPAAIPLFSTVTERFVDGGELDAHYWAANLRQPVLFSGAVRQLLDCGHGRFVELSAHPVLLGAVADTMERSGQRAARIASMKRDTDERLTMLVALGALYVDGYPVDWRNVYRDAHRPVALPAYPWQRSHHWIDDVATPSLSHRGAPQHPLLGWRRDTADETAPQVWENSFDARDMPQLYQLRIDGARTLPDAALLGFALAPRGPERPFERGGGPERPFERGGGPERPFERGGGPERPFEREAWLQSIEDVRFDKPMVLDDDELTAVQVIVDPRPDSSASISVYSRNGAQWIRHLRAAVGPAFDERSSVDLAEMHALRQRAASRLDPSDASAFLQTAGVVVGENADRIARLWCCDGALLAELSEPAGGDATIAMLDACLQVACFSALADQSAPQSPMTATYAGRVQIHQPWIKGGSCLVRLRAVNDDGRAVVDVELFGPTGEILATIDDLRLRPVEQGADRPDDWFYGVEWQPVDGPASTRSPAVANWVVVNDRGGYGDALAAALAADGATYAIVPADGDIAIAATSLGESSLGDIVDIVYLRGLDAPAVADVRVGDLEGIQRRACGDLLTLVHSLIRSPRPARIHVVTRGAQRVGAHDEGPAVMQAPLWGLGRALSEELPDMFGSLIDLDPIASPERAVAGLVREVCRAGADGEVALRGDTRSVARLVRQVPRSASAVPIRSDATYLITGGFGNLGAAVARWLVSQGTRRLILMGRTKLPPRAQWGDFAPDGPIGHRATVIRQLEALGAAVHVASVDVGDESQLRAYLDEFRAEGWPAIRGVVHTATLLTSTLLGDLGSDSLWEQLRPKLVGAWTLSELLDDLDHFVLYSSVKAVLPQPGQGAYVAANTFLDALAHHRAARGQAALSVNWGYWSGSGGGLLGEEWRRSIEQMESQGFRGFRVDQGLEALGRMVGGDAAQMVFLPIDWAIYDAARTTGPMVSQLIVDARNSRVDRAETRAIVSLPERLASAAPDDRPEIIEAVLRRIVARILTMPESQIDAAQPLGELGLDSLMGVELRNRLEAELRLRLSATLAWNYPTVTDLGAHLLAKLGYPLVATEAVHDIQPHHAPTSFEQLLSDADALADDDALRELMRRTTR